MDLENIVHIAELAGDAILEIYSKPETMNIQHKGDNSPLTAADLAAHNIIVRELRKIDNTPIVSEEGNEGDPMSSDTCWLVDPPRRDKRIHQKERNVYCEHCPNAS